MSAVENEAANNTAEAIHRDYQTELLNIIRSPLTPAILADKLSEYHEGDIATVLELLTPEERTRLYRAVDSEFLSGILEYVDDITPYFQELNLRKKIEVLSLLEIDTAVEYLQKLSKEERNTLVGLMDEEFRHDVALLSSFDEDEIGSRMTTNYISVEEGLSIRQAMRSLIDQAAENDNISTLYVTKADETFCGAIDLKDLIIARDTDTLADLIIVSYPYVYAEELIEDCIERIKSYAEDSIPVLDEDNKLIGVITAQDIVSVVDEELGEDYAKLAGLTAEEDLKEPIRVSVKKRIPWLIVLLGLALLVSSVVGLFETVVVGLPMIICFQSLILDMAGNVGTQSLAVTIRVLMDNKLEKKQRRHLIFKEGRIGVINGFLLGTLSFVLTGAYIFLFKHEPAASAFSISFCIGLALMIAMTLSSIVGTVVPLFFKKIKIDPAVASGPFITTLNDLVAVITYYSLAWVLLLQIAK